MPYTRDHRYETCEPREFFNPQHVICAASRSQVVQHVPKINVATFLRTNQESAENEQDVGATSKAPSITAESLAAHDLQLRVTSAVEDTWGSNTLPISSLRGVQFQNELIGCREELAGFASSAESKQKNPLEHSCAMPHELTNTPVLSKIVEETSRVPTFSKNDEGSMLTSEPAPENCMCSASCNGADGTSRLKEPASPTSMQSHSYCEQDNEVEHPPEESSMIMKGTSGKQRWRHENSDSPPLNSDSTTCSKKATIVPDTAAEQTTDEGSSDEASSLDDLITMSPQSSQGLPALEHLFAHTQPAEVDALIFDLDDTLYTVSCGFSDHRNAEVTVKFLVEEVGFPSYAGAKSLRDEYFQRYHSTLKGLAIASRDGRLPRPFNELELGDFWAGQCDFEKYLKPDPCLIETLGSLRDDAGLTLVTFTNSPVRYALRCLEFLGLRGIFADEHVFGIEDVLPHCKPEQVAFEKVLKAAGLRAERTVMFEDSMKNIKACKAMGMHTVLIDETAGGSSGGEAALLNDLPTPDDPAVDVVMRSVNQIRTAIPALWHKRF